jgi:hypothetical protein
MLMDNAAKDSWQQVIGSVSVGADLIFQINQI